MGTSVLVFGSAPIAGRGLVPGSFGHKRRRRLMPMMPRDAEACDRYVVADAVGPAIPPPANMRIMTATVILW